MGDRRVIEHPVRERDQTRREQLDVVTLVVIELELDDQRSQPARAERFCHDVVVSPGKQDQADWALRHTEAAVKLPTPDLDVDRYERVVAAQHAEPFMQ